MTFRKPSLHQKLTFTRGNAPPLISFSHKMSAKTDNEPAVIFLSTFFRKKLRFSPSQLATSSVQDTR